METIVTLISVVVNGVVITSVVLLLALVLPAVIKSAMGTVKKVVESNTAAVLEKLDTDRQVIIVANVEDMIREEVADLNLDVTDEDAVRKTLMNEIEQLGLCDDCSDKVVTELSQILSTL